MNEHVCVVTGASSGIGAAVAIALAAPGRTVCLVGRDERRLGETADAATRRGATVVSWPTDLSCDDALARLAEHIGSIASGVDVLVHAAGALAFGQLADSQVEQFDHLYRLNVRAPFLLTRALLPLVTACRGQVVFINSVAGIRARANLGLYAASKHALKALADSLREEVSGAGVRVVTVLPGRTATPMQEWLCAQEGEPYIPERYLRSEDVADIVTRAVFGPSRAQLGDIVIRPAASGRSVTSSGGTRA